MSYKLGAIDSLLVLTAEMAERCTETIAVLSSDFFMWGCMK